MTLATTADELLSDLKTRAGIPDLDGRFGSTAALINAALLRILDETIRTKLGVSVYRAADGRWIAQTDLTLTVNVESYALPERCWSGSMGQVSLVDSAGNESLPLEYVEWEDLVAEEGVWAAPRYTFVGDSLQLLPAPTDATLTLRVRYVRRPSRLALVAACTKLTAVGATTLSGTIGSGWTSPTVVDLVRGNTHGTPLEDDVAVTFTGTTITRSSGTTATTGAKLVAIGDYACLEGTTCIPQVPEEALTYVLEQAAVICSRVMGDMEALRMHSTAAHEAQGDLNKAIGKRSDKSAKAINRTSPLRFAGRRR